MCVLEIFADFMNDICVRCAFIFCEILAKDAAAAAAVAAMPVL